MIERVLCARDFSSASERAFSYAVDLSERTRAALHLMYVEEISLGFMQGDPSPAPGERALQEGFERQCRDDLSARPRTVDDDRVTSVAIRSGAIAPALTKYAKQHDADLLAMGTQGRRGIERVMFGSVAEEVLRTAPCPVLTTRALPTDASANEDRAGEASSADASSAEVSSTPASVPPIDLVVAPVDFSDASRGALRYAARVASMYDVPLTLVHVVNLPHVPNAYGIEFTPASESELKERATAELETWAEDVVGDDVDVSLGVTGGDPVAAILDAASTPGDLLVMATRGLSGVKRLMLGSVAEGVLREAKGPVLSCRSFPDVESS